LVALEPRILLDAAGFVTGAEVAMDALISDDTQTGVDAIFNPDSLETFETYDTSDQLIRALEADTGSESNEYVIPMHNPEEIELSEYVIPMSEIEDLVVSEIEGRNFITSEAGVDYLIPVSDVEEYGEQISASIEAASDDTTIVFVDTSISDYQTLIDGLPEGTEVILIEADVDGVEFIAETLANRSDIDAQMRISYFMAVTLVQMVRPSKP